MKFRFYIGLLAVLLVVALPLAPAPAHAESVEQLGANYQMAMQAYESAVVERAQNGGPGAARNVALDRARGRYVMYVDADDGLVADALAKFVARADAQKLDELYFSAQSYYEDGAVYDILNEDFSNREPFEGVATGRELFTVCSDRGQYFPQGALRMVRRELVEREHIRFLDRAYRKMMQTLLTYPAERFNDFFYYNICLVITDYFEIDGVESYRDITVKLMKRLTGNLYRSFCSDITGSPTEFQNAHSDSS